VQVLQVLQVQGLPPDQAQYKLVVLQAGIRHYSRGSQPRVQHHRGLLQQGAYKEEMQAAIVVMVTPMAAMVTQVRD
jgi:hypothetical protein